VSRRSEEAERLERENAMLRKQIERFYQDPGDLPVAGCGDSSCQVAQASGMSTNGGCRCDERTLRRALSFYKRLAQFRAETIRIMKSERETP
jgi:hypothetical protein